MIFDQSSPRSSVSLDPPFVQMFWLSAFSRSLADGDLVFNHKEHLRMWWKDVKVEAGSTRAALAQTINPLMTMNLSTPSGCDNTIAHIGNNYSLQSMVVLPYQCPRPNNHKIISRKSISNRNDVWHAMTYLWLKPSLRCLLVRWAVHPSLYLLDKIWLGNRGFMIRKGLQSLVLMKLKHIDFSLWLQNQMMPS